MNFSHLLIPIVPEQAIKESFEQVFNIADQQASHVTLLAVIEELAEFKEIYRYSGTTLNILDKATQVYHDALKQHVQTLKHRYHNIHFHTQIRIGIPSIEIIKQAQASHASMVVIDSHRENKTIACQRGSNTLNLMRKSEVPIWSISTDATEVKRVIAAIDLTNQDYHAFNEQIVALAVEYCDMVGAELTLTHAWRLESEGFLRKWSGYEDIDIALLSKKMRDERLERLQALLGPYQDSTVTKKVELLEGETRAVLPEYVVNHQVDLVILGSLSRTGVAGFLMGNTAESVLNQLDCSVITLKPDSFQSPVLQQSDA
ncbi:universal stress protein [Photobacterium jeanii]|uniref:Universal stress protein n=1 Tax=Photobacterium jeanii TaxID=858640 RepID=A0A178K215_9GAMM|nr:universal stress protein [Photobacterium jeanii]OAN11146.1 universal stress protein [Photobacterium jeanii]PST90665.1 universal stress protein [Photobacterium jeanii]